MDYKLIFEFLVFFIFFLLTDPACKLKKKNNMPDLEINKKEIED